VPFERLAKENLRSIAHQPDYDTSYVSYRQAEKDCLFSYHGNRYSVPHRYAGKTVVVKEPVEGGQIVICHQQEQIAKHPLAVGKGAMVIDAEHYRGLPRRDRMRKTTPELPKRELSAGPGLAGTLRFRKWKFAPLMI
jgi:hypothetical protein